MNKHAGYQAAETNHIAQLEQMPVMPLRCPNKKTLRRGNLRVRVGGEMQSGAERVMNLFYV